jgi:hypothetical protein
MTATESTVIDPSGAAVAGFSPADVTKPLVDATHSIYQSALGGVEWYVEHWVDIFEEIKAEQAARLPSVQVADILGGLGDARIASDIPGRARLRLPQIKKQTALCAELAELVKAAPGVDAVHVSTVTGSILVHYDTDQASSLAELLAAIRAQA